MENIRLHLTNSKYNFILFFSGLAAGILILLFVGFYLSNKNDGTNLNGYISDRASSSGFRITIPELPSNLEFAGENVPLQNFEVKERIEREFLVNAYWYSATVLVLQRAHRWFPVIEPVLKRYGVPDDFKYIAVVESNLFNSVSPAGAAGYWQLLDDVAEKYGLEVNNEIDERYDVDKSTEAACRYFLDAYNIFKSWTLVAASYNMGKTGLLKQIEKQKVKNYYNLLLSDETSRYVARIISIKSIFMHPEEYGYYLKPDELFMPLITYNVEINAPVNNWADFAISHEINYKILKNYNPWLRDISLTNRGKKNYEIKIPVKGSIMMIDDK
jgi:hypothetical protein